MNFCRFLPLILLFSLIGNTYAVQKEEGGNGGSRGGGDRVAGDFMQYERIVLAKLEAWSKQGKISITEAKLEKLRALMPPNQGDKSGHIVTSEDHVCITEGKRPDGNCLRKEDERDVIKLPFAKPPRIIVGRIRWEDPSNTPAKKGYTTLHELWGLAFSTPGRPFSDEAFEKTFALLDSASKEWNAVVSTHLAFMQKIRFYDEMYEMVDLSQFQTAKDAFVQTSSDYLRCIGSSDAEVAEVKKVSGKLAEKINQESEDLFANLKKIEAAENAILNTGVAQACARAGDQFFSLLTKTAGPRIQTQLGNVVEKQNKTLIEWRAWVQTVKSPRWKAWLQSTLESYISQHEAVVKENAITSESANRILVPLLDAKCPREKLADFRAVAVCNIDAGIDVANAYYKTVLGKQVDGLVSIHEAMIEKLASQVDPL